MIFAGAPASSERGAIDDATAEAARRNAPVLLTLTRRVEPLDALALYAAAAASFDEAAYVTQPSAGLEMAAAGAAWSFEARGERRFADAAAAWRGLAAGVAGDRDALLCLAGFAFAPDAARTGAWAPFGDGRLVLPELLYRREGAAARLTRTVAVAAGDAEAAATRLAELDRTLETSVEAAARAKQPGVAARVEAVDEGAWKDAVRRTAAAVRGGALDKAVLAREVVLSGDGAFDAAGAIARLREGYAACTVFAWHRDGATFAGATPERLVRADAKRVLATCLAGSAPRGADEREDEAAGAALLADAKERREHDLVVRAIEEALAPLCASLDVPREPRLLRMPNVQHLYTPIEGTLADGEGALDLVERLHPTPAVCGLPRGLALRAIAEHEPFDRGWYAGPLGWVDASGAGEFVVAIRSALLRGREARLYAGCGIVGASDADREWAEAGLKLRPMLWALGQA